jgi:hypothetical protein
MPLSKILLKPGVNRENTRYTTEGGWYECDKIRFRQGTPEKIGGWQRISESTFLGVCRSLWNWVTLSNVNIVGVGTNLKFYLEQGGAYSDITPIRGAATLTNPFAATLGSAVVTVTDVAHGCTNGDFVTFTGATGLGGNITAAVLNREYQVSVITGDVFTINVGIAANATDVSGSPGGGTVTATYQINVGPEFQVPLTGWGAGAWGSGVWGTGGSSFISLRLWSQANFGEDLLFAPRDGGIYYWDATSGITARGVLLQSLLGASDVPTVQKFIFVSDVSRFVLAFGCNEAGSAVQNPLLIRWSDQEDAINWTPAPTNQAGSLQLSRGSEIISCIQTRQEILVWTDSALYSLQYLGPPFIWGAQQLGDNISIIGPNAVALASGVVYWMGMDKFYAYDGRVQTLNCDLRRYVFNDLNKSQSQQIFAGTNEGFNEVWWYYCSADSVVVDKYVVFNYAENSWYYGTLGRTAWLDSGLRDYPLAATYTRNLVNHEEGVDDNEGNDAAPITAYISSSEFDIEDGHNVAQVWRMLPDVTFDGSTEGASPELTMTLYGMTNSGSGVTSGKSRDVLKGSTYVITEEFTGQIYTRVRGRQMIMKAESTKLGTTWQLGAPRLDIRKDGRR